MHSYLELTLSKGRRGLRGEAGVEERFSGGTNIPPAGYPWSRCDIDNNLSARNERIKLTTNWNLLFRPRDWLSANQGSAFPDSVASYLSVDLLSSASMFFSFWFSNWISDNWRCDWSNWSVKCSILLFSCLFEVARSSRTFVSTSALSNEDRVITQHSATDRHK